MKKLLIRILWPIIKEILVIFTREVLDYFIKVLIEIIRSWGQKDSNKSDQELADLYEKAAKEEDELKKEALLKEAEQIKREKEIKQKQREEFVEAIRVARESAQSEIGIKVNQLELKDILNIDDENKTKLTIKQNIKMLGEKKNKEKK